MEITNQDEAKDEVERLLIAPITIGSMWLCRSKAPRAVVVQGLVNGKVCIAEVSGKSRGEYYIVDFHAYFISLHFD